MSDMDSLNDVGLWIAIAIAALLTLVIWSIKRHRDPKLRAGHGARLEELLPSLAGLSLGAPVDEVTQQGSGPNQQRQEAPHPHAVTFDPAGRYIATADLGIDKVEIFELREGGELAKISEAAMEPA